MNYKRLTKHCEVGIGLNKHSIDITEAYIDVITRLCELEDKIENGTLVELPRNKIKIRDDKEADWNSQNFPKGSGGPYDYGYKGEE